VYVQVRLYINQDYELLALLKNPYYKLDDLIHGAVCAHVRGEEYEIPYSKLKPGAVSKESVRICVTFDENEDADVIEWLNNIKYGLRTSAVKTITKRCITAEMFNDAVLVSGEENYKPVKGNVYNKKSKSTGNSKTVKNVSLPDKVRNKADSAAEEDKVVPIMEENESPDLTETADTINSNDENESGSSIMDFIDSLPGEM